MINSDGNRRLEGKRLIYYSNKPDSAFWEDQWQIKFTEKYYAPFRNGHLGLLNNPFLNHLPKNGLILEAGCGTGQWVVALRARGYNCIGLDYAINSLINATTIVPAPYIGGDVLNLCLANDCVDAIISLGVVEHRWAGPEPFLFEMRRILKNKGKLLISVPFFNSLRLWRAQHGAYNDNPAGLDFYQQAFTDEEFFSILKNTGYKVISHYSYDHRKCLRQELNIISKFGNQFSRIFQKCSDYIPYINTHLGHMLLVVAEKI